MFIKKQFPVLLVCIAVFIVLAASLLAYPAPTQARSSPQVDDGSKCVTCHEDLYQLHDTGKAYCLKDSPMACVDCHGGNPNALTKEEAHYNRAAHPVINDDDKKCYECHPAQAEERVLEFGQVAGIKEIKVAIPCEPASKSSEIEFPVSKSASIPLSIPAIALFTVVGLMAAVFIAFKLRNG